MRRKRKMTRMVRVKMKRRGKMMTTKRKMTKRMRQKRGILRRWRNKDPRAR